MDNHRVIAALNNLLKTTNDGARGFRTYAEGITNPRLKTLLQAAASRYEDYAAELKDSIAGLGGEPATCGTASGSLHRAWTDTFSPVSGKVERAVLAECERCEDFRKVVYEAALEEDLPLDVKAIVRRQYQGVTNSHDRIRDLRTHAAQAWGAVSGAHADMPRAVKRESSIRSI